MTTSTLATLIARADRAWCKDNAADQRPRDWATDLAAVVERQAIAPLRDRIAQLEAWCSCAKPPWPNGGGS